MARFVVYDDGRGRLGPLTDLRAAHEVRTGAWTSLERLERAVGRPADALHVQDRVLSLAAERAHRPLWAGPAGADDWLCLNGRCALPPADAASLQPGDALVEDESGDVVAARLGAAGAAHLLEKGELSRGVRVRTIGSCLLRRPWDVVRFRDQAIRADLGAICANAKDRPEGAIVVGAGALSAAASARIWPGAVFDVEHGPIRIDEGAVVRPGAILCGPVFVGAGSTIVDRALIKANTAIGARCKVAGEVGGTIFQGWSNKGHDGHLGDSWVGEWVNFGAGTTNSNLLNTYGEVAACAAAGSSIERTGLTFLGCIVGDHAKFAIGTRLMTGAVVGTGAMWAATAPVSGATVPFTWATDAGVKAHRFDRFMETARAMMGRRGVTPGAAFEKAARALASAAGGAP